VNRRDLIVGSGAMLVGGPYPRRLLANVPVPSITRARSHVYNKGVPFVAFTKLEGETIKGTHGR
jgi:hypothetical protein